MGRRPAAPIDETRVRNLRQPYYTTAETALVIRRNQDTVRRYLHLGSFPNAKNLGGSTGHLIPRADLVAFLRRT